MANSTEKVVENMSKVEIAVVESTSNELKPRPRGRTPKGMSGWDPVRGEWIADENSNITAPTQDAANMATKALAELGLTFDDASSTTSGSSGDSKMTPEEKAAKRAEKKAAREAKAEADKLEKTQKKAAKEALKAEKAAAILAEKTAKEAMKASKKAEKEAAVAAEKEKKAAEKAAKLAAKAEKDALAAAEKEKKAAAKGVPAATKAQVLVRWSLQRGFCALPRSGPASTTERLAIRQNSARGVSGVGFDPPLSSLSPSFSEVYGSTYDGVSPTWSGGPLSVAEMKALDAMDEGLAAGRLGRTDGWTAADVTGEDWDPTASSL